MPNHSTFSKVRHGQLHDADLLRQVFETVVRRCIAEVLWEARALPSMAASSAEYLTVLDDAAFGAATTVQPKFTSPVDLAARWTAASR